MGIRQEFFENVGQTRPNILVKTTAVALTVVSAFAIAGCASGDRDNDSSPSIEQISEDNESVDISSLDEKQQLLFKQLETAHEGGIDDFSALAQKNQYLLGVYADEFNDLTVEINGRDVNCGIAENIWFVAEDRPAGFESDDFDPTHYERACGGFATGRELGLFFPYMGTMKSVIEGDDVLDKMQPELAAGLIQRTGQELIIADQNSEDRQSIVDELSHIVETWDGPGYIPTETEVGDIFDLAKEGIYGVTTAELPGDAFSAAPEPAEIPVEPTPPVVNGYEEMLDPDALIPFSSVIDMYKNVAPDFYEPETFQLKDKASGTYMNCADLVNGGNPCSDQQAYALYTGAATADRFYEASMVPSDIVIFSIYNLVLQSDGNLQTYTRESLMEDTKSLMSRDVSDEDLLSAVWQVADTVGVKLPAK